MSTCATAARAAHLYARSVRAQQQWVQRAGREGVRIGPYQVDPAARSVDGRQYDLILVFYGWEPQAGFADDLRLARDERGYISTDFATAETSVCRHLRHRRGGAPHASLRGDVHGRWRGGGQGHPAALGARRGMSGLAADAWPQYLPDSSSPASGTRVSRPSSCSIR